ncbi:MAG: hypothetical protein LBT46_08405, partial [Planctomycetaceae bacterium]|nr:hypothetical protein [Planctomycetaceae bacterium]
RPKRFLRNCFQDRNAEDFLAEVRKRSLTGGAQFFTSANRSSSLGKPLVCEANQSAFRRLVIC